MAKSGPKDYGLISSSSSSNEKVHKKEKKKKHKKEKKKCRQLLEEDAFTGKTDKTEEYSTAELASSAKAELSSNKDNENGHHTKKKKKKKYKKVKVEEVLQTSSDDILALKLKSRKRCDKKENQKVEKKDKDSQHQAEKKRTTTLAEVEDNNERSSITSAKDKKSKKKSKKRKHHDETPDEKDDSNEKTNRKHAKRQRTEKKSAELIATGTDNHSQDINVANAKKSDHGDPRIVESSALEFTDQPSLKNGVTLVLFYQYVEPIWSLEVYQKVLKDMEKLGKNLNITGRMRVAREGLNCTLTSSRDNIIKFCQNLRKKPEFKNTEFKLTNDLPEQQRFPHLKVIEVIELVHYGLEGEKAPPIQEYKGCHLEPKDYHQKIAEKDTVMIDVRNHYEAIIGHFQPPGKDQWLDPMMRKSTEFPVWLDKPETKEKLKGKQVLMYCTGGIRCERATALLKYKMENDPEIKDLGIKEVYQLQGGIDKYFKEFPDGGFWKGKNYVFDKRFAHAPAEVECKERKGEAKQEPMGKCEACQKPWDRFRGKRRCPTCGVPSLICKDCFLEDQKTKKKKLREVRCDLCVAENVTSKAQLRAKEQMEIELYEQKLAQQGLIPQPEFQGERLKATPSVPVSPGASKPKPKSVPKLQTAKGNRCKKDGNKKINDICKKNPSPKQISNPDNVTRLYLKNMCRETMNEETLMEFLPGITHIVWKSDGKTGQFLGQGWVEMATPEDAAKAVAKNGQRVLNRPLYINFQQPDPKDVWPPPRSSVEYLTNG